MPNLTTLLKSAALASVTVFAATASAAQEFTVYVYERGFFPNIVYTDDATSIRFVNETIYNIGIDRKVDNEVIVRVIRSGNSEVAQVSDLIGNEARGPFIHNLGGYFVNGQSFKVVSGAAPGS